MRRISTKALAATAIAGVAIVPFASQPASAAPPGLHVVKTLASSYVGPLQFAVDGNRVLVSDSFTSTLWAIGRTAPLATGGNPEQGGDIGGVAIDPASHAYAFTTTNAESHTHTTLTIRTPGHKAVVADLSGYERTKNPDHVRIYGVTGNNPLSSCVKDSLLKLTGLPARYRGQVDSHPYAVAALGNGAWAVADAGGNDIVNVSRTGHVSTIAVLPAQPPVTFTADFVHAAGGPDCLIGLKYRFESVPTDVELGPTGKMYATTLPGGEGAPGSVYRLYASGRHKLIATGFVSATNLAIGPHGGIYVAELFSGTISKVSHGAPQRLMSLPGVVALEWANGHLYASTAPAIVSGGDGPPAPGAVYLLGF